MSVLNSRQRLAGFKSFRDEVRIGPLDDFTCIIGPNGQGKSVLVRACVCCIAAALSTPGTSTSDLLKPLAQEITKKTC